MHRRAHPRSWPTTKYVINLFNICVEELDECKTQRDVKQQQTVDLDTQLRQAQGILIKVLFTLYRKY